MISRRLSELSSLVGRVPNPGGRKTCGLECFLHKRYLSQMKTKELKKAVSAALKFNQSLDADQLHLTYVTTAAEACSVGTHTFEMQMVLSHVLGSADSEVRLDRQSR